jgi:DNA-binding transcriptional MerR regulator
MPSESFSTSQALQLTGATARQLQWWDEHALVVPLRVGRRRLYSASDLADILVILELRRRHISLQQVRKVLQFLKRELHVRPADLVLDDTDPALPDYHLLIDGSRLYLETDARQIFDLLKNTEQAVFLISLGATARKLEVAGLTLLARETPAARKLPGRDASAHSNAEGRSRIVA